MRGISPYGIAPYGLNSAAAAVATFLAAMLKPILQAVNRAGTY